MIQSVLIFFFLFLFFFAGPISWVHEQMRKGQSPRSILEKLVPKDTMIPEGLDVVTLWKIIISIVSEPPKRSKLEGINTMDDVIHLLRTCKKIIVLTGAGVIIIFFLCLAAATFHHRNKMPCVALLSIMFSNSSFGMGR